jgi:hypothetical protein
LDKFLCHIDAISYFNQKTYKDIIKVEDLVSKKKCINLQEKHYGYFFRVGLELFFLPDKFVKSLPLKVTKKVEVDYKSDVFFLVVGVAPVAIPIEKKMEFRELVDIVCNFEHTNPTHFKLYSILTIASYIDRANYRVSTEAGFGKDSIVNILNGLVGNIANVYGATFAKLEYVLKNNFILFNEMGNLKPDDKANMQEFLLHCGAFFNSYTKRTRAKDGKTLEVYDISKLSLGIVYNLPEYYVEKGQEYFDTMFTKAVINRFVPFVFEGRLTTDFEKSFNIPKMVEENKQTYRDLISTLNYFKEYGVSPFNSNLDLGVTLKRYSRSINVISKYIKEYSKDEKEYEEMFMELLSCYKKYGELI